MYNRKIIDTIEAECIGLITGYKGSDALSLTNLDEVYPVLDDSDKITEEFDQGQSSIDYEVLIVSSPASDIDLIKSTLNYFTSIQKVIVFFHGLNMFYPRKSTVESLEEMRSNKLQIRYVVCSQEEMRIRSRYVPTHEFYYLPHYSDLECSSDSQIDRPRNYILIIARVVAQKGIEATLELFKDIDIDIKLVGKTKVMSKVDRLKSIRDFDYIGTVGRDQMVGLIENALLVSHLIKYREGGVIALHESLSLGTPILVNEIQGLRGLLSQGVYHEGDYYSPTDIIGAAKSVDNDSIRREYRSKYSEKLWVEKLLGIINDG